MPKIDAAFLRNVQEHCNGGLEWCEKRDIERLDLVKVSVETAAIAAKEDAGMASYGVAMFKLGYEVAQAQRDHDAPRQFEEWSKRVDCMDETTRQGRR